MITKEEIMFQKLSGVEEFDFGLIDRGERYQFLNLCLSCGLIEEEIVEGVSFYIATHGMTYQFTDRSIGITVYPPCVLFVQSHSSEDIEYVEGTIPDEHKAILYEQFID